MSVKVRIAPSPTGNLHIGTARTALFNWLFARANGGQFILRIEDTDRERSKPEHEKSIIDGLRWLGISWDNEEVERQSERLPLYKKYLTELVDAGLARERTFTEEEKNAMRAEGREPRDSIIILTPPDDPRRMVGFDDIIRGRVEVEAQHIGQVSLAKDLDTPLYNFAAVVDDLDMDITHVIRGEDHISNTPKQLLIYEALGATPPKFAHLPLILGEDRSKMSKRHGATSIMEYQEDYLPQAMVNFMGLLGYTYDRELLLPGEMAQQFDLAKVHKSGAVFDVRKLNWFNAQYLKQLSPHEFKGVVRKPELADAAVPIMTERLERLSDVVQFTYFWQEPEYPAALLRWKNDPDESTVRALTMLGTLAGDGDLDAAHVDTLVQEHFGGQKGSVYWPLRVALSGAKNSAGPLEIASAIGPAAVKARIAIALRKLRV